MLAISITCMENTTIDSIDSIDSIGWCLTITKSICAKCGAGNGLRRLRMANEIQCIIPYVT